MTNQIFSEQINLPLKYLLRLAKNADKLYNVFYIPKKSGAFRQIESPSRELKGIQRWILDNIISKTDIPDCVTGYKKNVGIKKNASIHLGFKYVICIDIKDFFPSIKKENVYSYFIENCDSNCAKMLSNLCTYGGKLPQGAVTSPALSNCVFRKIDDDIDFICRQKRIQYSRYADDITISSNNKDRLLSISEKVKDLIQENGYIINTNKTRILSGRSRIRITGINVNNNKLSIGRKKKQELRAAFHHMIIKKNDVNENRIMGALTFLRYIEPGKYETFKKYINNLVNNA